MSCSLCSTRPVPSNYGSPRRCAFDSEGNFTPENWNCETVNELRDIMSSGPDWQTFNSRCNDGSIGLVYVPEQTDSSGDFVGGSFWILGFWYKERGQIENLYFEEHRSEKNGGHVLRPMTLATAEHALSILLKEKLQ